MRRKLTVLVAGAAALVLAVPAAAVTNGTPDAADGDTYDGVGNLFFWVPDATDSRFDDPGSWFTCTGTLVDEDIVVTAGHCTYGIGVEGASPTDVDAATLLAGGTDVWITFLADARDAFTDVVGELGSAAYDRDENDERYEDWSDALDASKDWTQATAYTHPSYDDDAFYLYDLGVLVLDKRTRIDESEWGTLPPVDYLDDLQTTARVDQLATVTGYGIQEIVPNFTAVDVRYEATVKLHSTVGLASKKGEDTSVVASNNNGKKARGGTCSGDSGGPLFEGVSDQDDGGLLIGVTSYGLSPNCTGIGGYYRIDKEADLAFITTFIDGGVWDYS